MPMKNKYGQTMKNYISTIKATSEQKASKIESDRGG